MAKVRVMNRQVVLWKQCEFSDATFLDREITLLFLTYVCTNFRQQTLKIIARITCSNTIHHNTAGYHFLFTTPSELIQRELIGYPSDVSHARCIILGFTYYFPFHGIHNIFIIFFLFLK